MSPRGSASTAHTFPMIALVFATASLAQEQDRSISDVPAINETKLFLQVVDKNTVYHLLRNGIKSLVEGSGRFKASQVEVYQVNSVAVAQLIEDVRRGREAINLGFDIGIFDYDPCQLIEVSSLRLIESSPGAYWIEGVCAYSDARAKFFGRIDSKTGNVGFALSNAEISYNVTSIDTSYQGQEFDGFVYALAYEIDLGELPDQTHRE